MNDTDKSSRDTFLLVGAAIASAAVAALLALASTLSGSGVWGQRDFAIAGTVLAIGVAVFAGSAAGLKRRGQRLLATLKQHAVPLVAMALLMLWLMVYLAADIFISIKPGHGGVLWKRFAGGTVTERVYGEGLHAIPPWDEMTIYELRYQQQSREFEVLSSDGLRYNVEVTVRYRLREQWLGLLHKCVGPHYVDTMLLPEVGAVTRLVTAQLRPDELYTSQRQASEAAIRQHLRLEISSCAPRQGVAGANDDAFLGVANEPRSGERYFEASDVFIRRVVLPPRVAEAIEAKLVQRQQMLEYDYRVDRERKEAERKGIEAEGLRVYNETVTRGLSANVLHWHGLQATLELAKSPNSKLLVIGSSDKGGLPLLLGSPTAWDPAAPASVDAAASGARPSASTSAMDGPAPMKVHR